MERKPFSFQLVLRWTLGLGILAAVVGLPLLYMRIVYVETRRLRPIAAGKFYRSGRMTAKGFEYALKKYKFRTVINLMEEEQDPMLRRSYFDSTLVSEKDLCKKYNAKFLFLPIHLVHAYKLEKRQPKTIAKFLEIMDNEENYPILLHCRAGLHRTGILTAVYRMEYDGWSSDRAWRELRKNGFGESRCFSDNMYIEQYVFDYKTRKARKAEQDKKAQLELYNVIMDSFLPGGF